MPDQVIMPEMPWSGRHDALPEEVAQALGLGLEMKVLDVRTWPEYDAYHIPGAQHLPIDDLPNKVQMLDPQENWVVVCEHGIRSRAATQFLLNLGFSNACNMVGGMANWPGPVESGK